MSQKSSLIHATEPQITKEGVRMALQPAQKSGRISDGRQLANRTINLASDWKSFVGRINAGAYGDAFVDGGEPDGDFVGANEGISKADFLSAISTFNALIALFDAGHNTNLEKISI